MTEIQTTRVNKLNSHHPVRIREYSHDRIVVVALSSPRDNEFSVYTINRSGLSTDFIFFKSRAYLDTFKTLPTLKQFTRRTA